MTDKTENNKELGAVDIINKIDNNERASALTQFTICYLARFSQWQITNKWLLIHSLMNQPRQRFQAMKLITEQIEDVKLITEEKNGKTSTLKVFSYNQN